MSGPILDLNPRRYMMVVLERGNGAFDEHWFANPLEELKDLPKIGLWEWRGRQEVSLPENEGPWVIPDPTKDPAANFSFKLKTERAWLKEHGQGFESVKRRFDAES